VICRKTATASILLLFTLLSGLIIAPLLHNSRAGLVRDKLIPTQGAVADVVWGVSRFFAENSILHRIDQILTTGFKESAFSLQVWTNLAAALACFIVACLVFNRFTEYVGSTPGGARSGLLARWTDRRVRGRVWRWPLMWKDFYFLAGGPVFLVAKTAFYLGLIAAMFWQYEWLWVIYGVSLPEAAWFAAVLIAVSEALLYATRFYHQERTEGTLPTLFVLPKSLISISYAKLAGCLLGSLPTLLMFIALAVFVPGPTIQEATVFQRLIPGCMLLLVLVHLTVLYSLIVRWGALPLALGTLLLGGTCIVPIVAAAVATIYTAGQGVWSAFGPVVYIGIVVSGALQVAIGWRLRTVAAQ